jgi:hypothetical protein
MKNQNLSWVWWHTIVIPALGKVRQEDQEFAASQGYILDPASKIARRQWVTPVILPTQEAEIKRIALEARLGK